MEVYTATKKHIVSEEFLQFTKITNNMIINVGDVEFEQLIKFHNRYSALSQEAKDELVDLIAPKSDEIITLITEYSTIPKGQKINLIVLATDLNIDSLTSLLCYIIAKEIRL
jgi:hypothetical protein